MIRINTILTIGSALLLSSGLSAAEKSTPGEAPKKVTYEDDVKPIFRQHCLNCHSQGDKRGGLALDSYGATMEGGGSGEIVFDDGDVDGSRLWQLVNHDDTPVMPPKQGKIDQAQLDVLKAWIEGGILENSGSKAKARPKNALAFAASSSGKPDGPPPMPKSLPQSVPVVTQRAAAVTAISASPWAPLIAVAGQKQIVLYHSETAELLGILPFDEGVAQSLRFSRDGKFLVAGGGEHSVRGVAVVYSIESGERIASVGDELDTVFDADCNDRMNRIALGGPQKMLRIFDATDGTQLFDLKKHTDWIYSVAFSPDGVLVASGDRSGGLCVWEAATGRLFLDLTDHKGAITSLSWRDDSNVLASSSADGTVKLWDMVAGKSIKSITVPGGGVNSVQFDHKGQLATAAKDRKVRLWDPAGKQIKEFAVMKEAVLETTISHDSSRIAYGDWTGEIRLTLVSDPKQTKQLAANPLPAKNRLETVKQLMVSTQAKLAPLAKAMEDATTALNSSKKLVADAQAKIKAHGDSVKTTEQAIAASKQAVAAFDADVPKLVAQSRKTHDAIIASRLTAKDPENAQATEAVARLESQLAAELTKLASSRRARIAKKTELTNQSKQLADSIGKLPALQASLKEHQAKVVSAENTWKSAKQAHDTVAKQLSEQEKKKQALATAAS